MCLFGISRTFEILLACDFIISDCGVGSTNSTAGGLKEFSIWFLGFLCEDLVRLA